jgi:hypothetical protein
MAMTANRIKLMNLWQTIEDLREPGDYERNSHLGVHLALHLRPLAGGTARVEHDLGVLAGVDHETDNPFGVPEHGSAQQRLAKVDRVFVFRGDNSGVSLYMLLSGRSQSTRKEFLGSAHSLALRRWVNSGQALRDLRFVSPSKFFVSTKATFSSSEVAQMMMSAGIGSSS